MMAAAPRMAVRTGTPPAVMSPGIFQRNISTRSQEPIKAPKIAPARPYGSRPWVIRSATKPQTTAMSSSTIKFSRFIQNASIPSNRLARCLLLPPTVFHRLVAPPRRARYGCDHRDNECMPELGERARAQLPDSAFAYIDSRGVRRLPINDEAHVRNALSRFNQVRFENEAARERARTRLLRAAKKYSIVPVGFMTGQWRAQSLQAAAGQAVIELGGLGTPGQLETRLRTVLGDPTLSVLYWSESVAAYLDGEGQAVALPGDGADRAVTLVRRQGQPMTALVHT